MEILLEWYDQNARDLPWRSPKPDPYHVMLSEFMLQQTTVAAVKPYFETFLAKWPDVFALAKADDDEVMQAWAGLGYYARARNLLKCAREIAKLGEFPNQKSALLKLPGIGDYTSAAIAAIAFGEATLPRDGNINRILARYFAIEDPINRPSKALEDAGLLWVHESRPGDVAQALMDLGATICRPKNPSCNDCPIAQNCKAFTQDRVGALPNKIKAKPKRILFANAWIHVDKANAIGYEMRPENVPLGGMWGLPTTEWREEIEPAKIGQYLGEINHVFTHINLTLKIYKRMDCPKNLRYFNQNELSKNQVPRLWQKAIEKLN